MTTIPAICATTGQSPHTVNKMLGAMILTGMQRNRIYGYTAYLELLNRAAQRWACTLLSLDGQSFFAGGECNKRGKHMGEKGYRVGAAVEARRRLPLIKWPGGKRALVGSILQFVPEQFGTYFEPFFGGGAVFFALQPSNAVLSDSNEELINAYTQIRDNPEALAHVLRSLKNSEPDYYKVRATVPPTQLQKAARLLYLTRLSFNGIHRVNLRGEFNVPYGYKTHLTPIDEEHLYFASSALSGAKLMAGDFEATTRDASEGDVVYFDPPYTVAHGLNGFVKYNERIFSWNDQERLAEHARALANRGCRVIVSNADHESIHTLYRGFRCHILKRLSVIAASSSHRRQITECVFSLNP